jgi:hypothetical protein
VLCALSSVLRDQLEVSGRFLFLCWEFKRKEYTSLTASVFVTVILSESGKHGTEFGGRRGFLSWHKYRHSAAELRLQRVNTAKPG